MADQHSEDEALSTDMRLIDSSPPEASSRTGRPDTG
jgi:hypothetical protein